MIAALRRPLALWILSLGLSGTVQGAWKVQQLTHCMGGTSDSPAISADGRRVVLVSSCDLVSEQNADHNRELFRWKEGGSLEQLTHTERCENREPALSRNGARIAFVTSCPFGEANSRHYQELALFEAGEVKLLTDTAGSAYEHPALAPSGRYLAFLSSADPLGRNPDHSQEVFLFDLAQPGKLVQELTADEQSACQDLVMADGVVAFAGNGKRGGTNPEGNFEIYAASVGSELHELTRTRDCENRDPELNRVGNLVLFRSNCNLTGQNLNRYSELFLSRGGAEIEQLTQDLAEGVFQPSLAGSGLRAAFVSRWGRGFQNPDHNPEIFVLDLAAGRPELVVETKNGGNYGPRLSADGRRLVFYANTNITDGNDDGSFEIYLAEEATSEGESP